MSDRFEKIDELFAKNDSTKSPGCAFAIVNDGEIIYKKGFGMATLEHSATIQPFTTFYIASCSKQFAAFSVALLEEKGLLSVQDDVRKYIPEIPDYGDIIQIQHLIHHTSGLRDYLELNALSGRDNDELITPEDALHLIVNQKQLNFKPGDRYLYSNSGYFLLSEIVLRITGQTLRQFAQENIFGPLGMKNTHFHDDRKEPVPHRAIGYQYSPEKGYRINVPGLETIGSGGIYSNVEDLALWDRNFYNNKLGKGDPALMERILETTRLNNGELIPYAFGLTVEKYRGMNRVEHAGNNGGYSAEFARFPEQKLTLICLSNSSLVSAPNIAMRAADILLGEYFTADLEQTPETIAPLELKQNDLRGKEGYYFSEEGEISLKIVLADKTLALDMGGTPLPLTPSSPSRFHLFNAPIRGTLDFSERNGKPIILFDFERGKKPETLIKLPEVALSVAEKQAMVGEYYSTELFATIKISLVGEELELKLGRHKGGLVTCENYLFIIEGDVLSNTILVAEMINGKVTGFTLNAGRVQNIQFLRK
ncbi:MAG: beta-lactamase family protein [Chloroflexi bacterium]|nr:beta-lactamase family protein [Chloroflexota bacterium]